MTKTRKRVVPLRRGFMVPVLAASIAIFLAALTLVVDGGQLFLAHANVVATADVAALAAASAAGAGASPRGAVEAFLLANGARDCAIEDVRSDPAGDELRVTVLLARSVRLLLASGGLRRQVVLRARATASSKGGRVRLLP